MDSPPPGPCLLDSPDSAKEPKGSHIALGYTPGGFRFPFRTVKVLSLRDNVRWALRGPGLSSALASYPPQNQKVTWPRATFPCFVKSGRVAHMMATGIGTIFVFQRPANP